MPDTRVWDELIAAHRRVEAEHPELSQLDRPPVHRPVAAILACSDARVPPSVVFDQAAGRVFVVRIAGNTATPAALASLDYAVAELGVELILVMGHTGCGAVQAAAGGTCGGYLAPIVEPICRLADAMPGATVDQLVTANVAATVDELVRHDGPVGDAARSRRLDVRGAVHDLCSGELDLIPNPTTSEPSKPHDLLETS
jgi:carbonic anhydrase